jgi:hypothetical protein
MQEPWLPLLPLSKSLSTWTLQQRATGRRKYDTPVSAARGGSISKPPPACDTMPPDFTQSVRAVHTHGKESKRTGSFTRCYYTPPDVDQQFTSLKVAWAHRGRRAGCSSDEAKEAAKEAAKKAAKEEAREAARPAREAAREAARPAREAAWEAAKASTGIANGDVIRCGRAVCQGTQKHTGGAPSCACGVGMCANKIML